MGKVAQMLKANHEKIIKLRNEGKTYKQIAENFGCSSTSIANYFRNNNLNEKDNCYGKYELVGQIIESSRLEVLEIDNNPPFKSHETGYKCKCLICGDIKTYRKSSVLKGKGCHECSGVIGGRGYRNYQVGQKFGFIEIIGPGEKEGYVQGKCSCGTIRDFRLSHLRGICRHRTISCGCKQKSSGELKIENILLENKINYQPQYQIKEFSSYALFDFAIFDKNGNLLKLIEFDGEQHFKPIEYFGGKEKFKIQKERDERKNLYCQEHNITLLRIPYWDYDKISLEYLFS